MRKWRVAGAVAAAGVVGVGVMTVVPVQAASPVYASSVTRAPYLTDVTQTSAEVNWATNVSTTAGSVQWVDQTAGGTCPTTAWKWSASTKQTANASTTIPYGLGTGTLGWGYSVASEPEYQNSAPMTGLVAGHTYCYAVFSAKTSSATDLLVSPTFQTFTTLQTVGASSTKTVTFDVIGDTGENFMKTSSTADTAFPGHPTSNPYESDLYSQIGTDGSQFLLGTGDTSYNGGTENTFGDLTHTGTAAQATGTGGTEYSNIFGPSYLPLARGIPSYLSDGNHGENNYILRFFPSQTTANASGGAYDMHTYNVDGASGSYPDDWYAFSTGNVRVYILDASWPDSNIGTASSIYQADADAHWKTSSPEYQWLKADLAKPANAGMVKFAVFHFPLQSATNSETSDTYLQQDLEPLLAQNGVAMAFNGHAHTYQRFIPDSSNQITSYVTGGGGGVPEPVIPNSNTSNPICTNLKAANSVYAIGWSPTTQTGTFCGQGTAPTLSDAGDLYSYLHVTVSGHTVTVVGVNADGHQFDAHTYQLSGGTPPPTTTTTSTSTTTTTTTTGTNPPPSAIKLVQSQGQSGAVTTLPRAATAGDLLVLSASQYTGATNHITGVTDNAGDTWHLIGANDVSGHNSEGELWWTDAIGSVSTVTAATNSTSLATEVQEFSGVRAGAPTSSAVTSGDSAAATAAATGGGLEVGFVAGHGNAEAITPTAGFTGQSQVQSSGSSSIASLITAYQTPGTATAFGGTFGSAMYWAAGVATFAAS